MYERFAELLKEKGVKVSDVSRATGIRQGVFSDWKMGRYKPKHDKMLLIAAYFMVSVEYLEGISDDKAADPQWQETGMAAYQDYDNYVEELRLEEEWRHDDFMATIEKIYKQLNREGSQHLLQTAQDMLQIDRFRKDTASRKRRAM